jgi:hypothetical protein
MRLTSTALSLAAGQSEDEGAVAGWAKTNLLFCVLLLLSALLPLQLIQRAARAQDGSSLKTALLQHVQHDLAAAGPAIGLQVLGVCCGRFKEALRVLCLLGPDGWGAGWCARLAAAGPAIGLQVLTAVLSVVHWEG